MLLFEIHDLNVYIIIPLNLKLLNFWYNDECFIQNLFTTI